MTLRKQFLLLGSLIVTIPVLCTLFIGTNNYINSYNRFLIQGNPITTSYKVTEDELKLIDNEDLKNELRYISPNVNVLVVDKTGKVIISTFGELPVNSILQDSDIVNHISNACENYFYQVTTYISKQSRYILIFRLDKARKKNSPKQLYISLLIFIAILVAINAFVLFSISRNLLKSLLKLQKKMSLIADGKLDEKVDITTNNKANELTSIEDSLEKMRNSLMDITNRKNKFIMGISHDLRTPVAVIKGYIEALSDGVISEEKDRNETYSLIKSKTDKLESMINTLINFVKLDSGDMRQNLIPQSITELIKTFAIDAQYTASVFKRVLMFDIDLPTNIKVPLDEQLVNRVFENLLSNALRYTNDGEEIKIIAYDNIKDHQIIFKIQDNGIGIDKKDLANIFDLFYRATNSRREEGLGIGLSVVKNIIETHGWKIRVNSEKGKGSCFSIIIPYE